MEVWEITVWVQEHFVVLLLVNECHIDVVALPRKDIEVQVHRINFPVRELTVVVVTAAAARLIFLLLLISAPTATATAATAAATTPAAAAAAAAVTVGWYFGKFKAVPAC